MLGKCHAQQQFHPFGMGSLSYPSSCLHGMLCIQCNAFVYDGISVATNVCFIRQFGANFQFHPTYLWYHILYMLGAVRTFSIISLHKFKFIVVFLSKSLVGNETPKISLLSNQIGIVALRVGCVCLAVGMRRHVHSFNRMNGRVLDEWTNVCLLMYVQLDLTRHFHWSISSRI